jgi:dTMP kinase
LVDRQSSSGKIINEILKGRGDMDSRAIHLLFSLNRWEVKDNLLRLLLKGNNVICDRYAFSGVAYSVSNGVPFEWCLGPDRGLPRPDLVIQLDSDIDSLKQREGYGLERYENEEFQRLVKENYRKFENYIYWKVMKANSGVDSIHRDVVKEVEGLINEYNNKPDNMTRNFYPNSIGQDLFTNSRI